MPYKGVSNLIAAAASTRLSAVGGVTSTVGKKSRLSSVGLMSDEPMIKPAFQLTIEGFNVKDAYVKDVRLPIPSMSEEKAYQQGHRVAYVSYKEQADLTVTFYEDDAGKVITEYDRWARIVFDPVTGAYGLPAEYKKNIVLQYINREDNISVVFAFGGCWPKSISGYEYDLAAEGGGSNITPAITFAVDTQEIYSEGRSTFSRNVSAATRGTFNLLNRRGAMPSSPRAIPPIDPDYLVRGSGPYKLPWTRL